MEVHPIAVGHDVQDRRPHLVEAVPWRSDRAATNARRGAELALIGRVATLRPATGRRRPRERRRG
ncbi:hypothetical protein, partial [Streptomyces mirabilis]|uniref:hypothetical protein n=1 Tax=Streptomyces mirabilis TaxID=68239 RepID=UPI0036DBECE8